MKQLTLFMEDNLNELNSLCENGLVCIKCDILQPVTNFQQMSYKNTEDAEIDHASLGIGR